MKKVIAVTQILSKTGSDVIKQAPNHTTCLIAADNIVDTISFIRHIVQLPESKFSPNPALAPAGFEF